MTTWAAPSRRWETCHLLYTISWLFCPNKARAVYKTCLEMHAYTNDQHASPSEDQDVMIPSQYHRNNCITDD